MEQTILQRKTEKHYVRLSREFQTGGAVLVAEVCPVIHGCLCGYPIRKTTYTESDTKKATATFKRYCTKYD